MKKIYIVLTYSGTLLSRIVRFYTRAEYSHVSLALDKDLEHMYSFGRINAYNPFIAGFVQESPHYGTFKRFKRTKTKIYSLEVKEEEYQNIQNVIHDIQNSSKKYRFNLIGLIAVMLQYHVKRERHFYCAEFVKYVFDNTNLKTDLPEVVKPCDFLRLAGSNEIYTGYLRDYL